MKKAKMYLSRICQHLPWGYEEETAQGKLFSGAVCSLYIQNYKPAMFSSNRRIVLTIHG